MLTPLHSRVHTRSRAAIEAPLEAITEALEEAATETNLCAFNAFVSLTEPKNIKEAILDLDWVAVMQEELHEFERNKIWHLVPKPSNRTIIVLVGSLETSSMTQVLW